MEQVYLITGITGFLGRTVAVKLKEQGEAVIGLRLPGDKKRLLDKVCYYLGDVSQKDTLTKFFEQAKGKEAVFIHCAGMVSIASNERNIWKINVDGTRNIVDMCEEYKIAKLIYVSSVHAIPELAKGHVIRETEVFSASLVEGAYGKSKAEATAYVKKEAQRGLPAVIVHPSGIIGPEDYSGSYMTKLFRIYVKYGVPLGIQGGYDFVDVRDVAEGIISCIGKGICGESYILSNEYITVKRILDTLSVITGKRKGYGNIPLCVMRRIASFCETMARKLRLSTLVTPYSIYTLGSNGRFSHEKADRVLGYSPRPFEETLADIVSWLREEERCRQ